MPERPDDAGDESSLYEAMLFGEFGYQESAPADLFPENGREIFDHRDRGGECEVEGNMSAGRISP